MKNQAWGEEIVTADNLDEMAIHPFIDVTGITGPGRYKLPVQVWIDGPSTVTARYVHPQMIEVMLVGRTAPAAPGAPGEK